MSLGDRPTPEVTVWSKAFVRTGFVGAPESLKLTLRHNAPSDCTLTVKSTHPYASALLANGARITVDYDGARILSGPIRNRAGVGGPASALTFTVEDDWRLLTRILCWPNPTGTLAQQGAATAYDTRTGAAETVAKGFLSANVARLGLPVTVAPSLGRGSSITVQARMHTPADRLLPAIDQAGIGLTVRQSGAGLLVDAYVPATYPRTLSDASGAITEWSFSSAGPTATRAVIGGQGEGTAREFRQRTATATEADWGDVVEVFVDARDTAVAAEQDARGDAALLEGAPTTGLKLSLSETETFRYGRSVRVGDVVTLQILSGALAYTDVIREAELAWETDTGFTITPAIGERTDDPSRTMARAVASLAKALRIDRAGR